MPLIRPDVSVPMHALLKRFALIYLPIAVALTIAVLLWVRLDAQRRVDGAEAREESRIEIARNLLVQDISVVDSDLRVIASLPALHHYLASGSVAWREELSRLLLVLAKEKRRYDQVRYLDGSGQEDIRINYNGGDPEIVPREQLQNKSQRYFFRDTFSLNQGEIYVSPLDLNIEHDRLEIPYKPMIRFGMPVFDGAGRKKGVIVINYLAGELLQDFRRVMHGGDPHEAMLLNRDGYWLSGPKPEDEWGFMLGKNERSFGTQFAAEWRDISGGERGILQTGRGLFVYATVYPLGPGQSSSTGANLPRAPSRHELMAHEYYWKIVSFVPDAALSGAIFYNQPGGRILLATTYLLLALAVWIIAVVGLGRRQAELELQEALVQARRFAETMNNVPAYIYIKNKHHQYVYGNRLVLELFKRSAEELPGSGDAEFFPPDAVARLKDIDDRVLERGETTQEEIDVAPDTPSHRVYWEVKRPIYDDQGEIWGLSGISTDITERKEAEEILALHAELVRQMAEGMVLIRTSNGMIEFANPAFERMFGYDAGELIGKPVAILNAPTERTPEETAGMIIDALRRSGVWSGEVENIRKDGARIWCLANVSTFVHPRYGEVWLSTHQDITSKKNVEDALRKSFEEIEDLYNRAPCGYHSLDEHGLVVRMNQTELEWLGYSREEVVGKMRFSEFLTPASLQIFRENFPHFLAAGHVHDLEFELIRKDGTLLPVLVGATAVRDWQGNFVMSRTTLFDLTERKKLERELERQARIDMLTGLNNRRHFFELAEPELARAKRHGEALSALMMDVDHFKRVNDTYGHHVGDMVLQKLSEVCVHVLREIDIVGRLGGEEFAILLPETDVPQALEAAERLRLAIAKAEIPLETGAPIRFTVSIGVAGLQATDSQIDAMLQRADAALYVAKNAGRNQVRFSD